MNIFTIGYSKKSAKQFFGLVSSHEINLLVDVRLHNKSQLAGFTKGQDLAYFLKEICHCDYIHDEIFAPTDDILKSYRNKEITWQQYVDRYLVLVNSRQCETRFSEVVSNHSNICLLCTEPLPEQCHRRLLAEYLATKLPNVTIYHI